MYKLSLIFYHLSQTTNKYECEEGKFILLEMKQDSPNSNDGKTKTKN